MEDKKDIAVIGGGPGGYVAALRAAQLKKKVILIEKHKIGGTCMNYGCIPSKYLLHQTKTMKEIRDNPNLEEPSPEIKLNWEKVQKNRVRTVTKLRKGTEFLLKKNGVQIVCGSGSLEEGKRVQVKRGKERWTFKADHVLLATGSSPEELSFLSTKNEKVITSQKALELREIPKKMIIVGAGAIGLEMGIIYHRMGCEVVVLEIMPTILPGSDKEMVTRLERILKKEGINIFTQMKIKESQIKKDKILLKGIDLKNQSSFEFDAEKVLLAAGRKANTDQILGESRLNLELDQKGFVKVNSQFETNIPGIYAVGDLTGGALLAHKASHEGILTVENIFGSKQTMNYRALPSAVYTDPEFSSVGLTEQKAQKEGISYKKGIFSLRANGRAVVMNKVEGMVKILADDEDKIIGAHIISPHASEIIPELTLAVKNEMKLPDISSSVHIHPTLSEAVMEGALKVRGESLHMLNK
ncbi:dihydrolipoyl dehydrogenase [bacterium]|nr:dihydrolipoyl dehydrogenase [bacterium]